MIRWTLENFDEKPQQNKKKQIGTLWEANVPRLVLFTHNYIVQQRCLSGLRAVEFFLFFFLVRSL